MRDARQARRAVAAQAGVAELAVPWLAMPWAAAALVGVAVLALAAVAAAQVGTHHGLTSIKLSPEHVRRSVGDKQYLIANGTFADGTVRNVTQRVEYRSSNAKAAVAENEPREKSRIDLVGIGRATISAVDPLTGVTSSDTGGDVEIRVVGALESITLTPTQAQCAVGETRHFTVTGHYPGGTTRNLTQRCKYFSSDPRVVLAPNLRGNKSRVEAVSPGTVTITALHPASGLTTHASGTSATLTVVGALESITLEPPHPRRAFGEAQHYTATGHYAGGAIRNLTQSVQYATSDDAIATAPNAAGDRSRIVAVALGTVTITAVDSETGISSSAGGGDAKLTVYDPAAPKGERGERVATGTPAALCGDASGDGALGVSDPLWIMAGVVGLAVCPQAVCDVDADGAVATRDAVTVCLVLAGYEVALRCP